MKIEKIEKQELKVAECKYEDVAEYFMLPLKEFYPDMKGIIPDGEEIKFEDHFVI